MTETSILCKDLSFSYQESPILENVDMTIQKGEFLALVGPNGGGKTTFLKLLLGLLQPSKGTISLFGKPPKQFYPRLAYVPQSLRFDKQFPITVYELVMMGALWRHSWLRGYAKQDKERAEELIHALNLCSLARRPIHALSGGQLQRALIARALLSDPEILMLDEPTSNIDSQSEAILKRLLEEMAGSRTLLMVTHELQSLSQSIDRVLYVHGSITSLQPHEVCSHYQMGLYHPPFAHNEGDA